MTHPSRIEKSGASDEKSWIPLHLPNICPISLSSLIMRESRMVSRYQLPRGSSILVMLWIGVDISTRLILNYCLICFDEL
jgi:hypothetical protein